MDIKIGDIKLSSVEVFIVSFIILYLSVAQSLNVFDLFTYAKTLKTDFENGLGMGYVISNSFLAYGGGEVNRALLYVLITYPYMQLASNIFQLDIEFALNLFSVIAVSLSSIFVYRTALLYFSRQLSSFAAIFYVLIPYVFFSGINASILSLQLLIGAAWMYLTARAMKEKDQTKIIASSLLFLINVLVHTGVILTLFAQIYAIYKTMGSRLHARYLASALPVALAVVYAASIILLGSAYPYSPSIQKTVFSLLLFSWEAVNGLSIFLALAVLLSTIFVIRRLFLGSGDDFDMLFLLVLIPTFYSLTFFHYVPIFNFNAAFPFLTIIFMKRFYNSSNLVFVVVLCLVFMLMTDALLYYQFHNFPHPHKQYAEWLQDTIESGTVFVGHECSAARLYTDLNVVCRGDENMPTDNAYFTSHYLGSENQLEFEYMQKYFRVNLRSIGSELEKENAFKDKQTMPVAVYFGPRRYMEDHYQWLYSVYPDPLSSVFLPKKFMQAEYSVSKIS